MTLHVPVAVAVVWMLLVALVIMRAEQWLTRRRAAMLAAAGAVIWVWLMVTFP